MNRTGRKRREPILYCDHCGEKLTDALSRAYGVCKEYRQEVYRQMGIIREEGPYRTDPDRLELSEPPGMVHRESPESPDSRG